uniref:Flagellar hook-length control protein-like C-terminal domain-containing protein n=2 Tax=Virgibacillus oceani TaxID=1479511 RepID=A0A917H7L2_9BACI|nr:hypothetical protein GCM10011398_11400 [Virgibacillus oceani]
MIAQLEVSLTTGENYHFQVQTTGDVIRLKVLGEQLNSQLQENVLKLMQHLGLKATKSSAALMKLLMNEKIPFDKEQLTKAIQLVEGAKNKGQAQQVIKEMITSKLPITDSIFQALYTKSTSGLSEQMNALLKQLKRDTVQVPLQQDLTDRLSMMLGRPLNSKDTFINQIISEAADNSQHLFNLLKNAGLIRSAINFSAWKENWVDFYNQNHANQSRMPSEGLPFQLNLEKSMQHLEQLNNIGKMSKTIIQQWTNSIVQALQNIAPLESSTFNTLKQQIEKALLPILPLKQQKQIVELLQNNPASLRKLLTGLQALANNYANVNSEQSIMKEGQGMPLLITNPKEQFLAQIRQVLQYTGLSDENQLMNNQQQTTTIKSMLTQLLQQSDGMVNERSQQLLHYINGLQIHSVNESANFIQASLQFPGEKLGLNGDMQLDFEGKKTETGEINPDFCRILFYLNLANLNETVIDMNIQKRTVAVTIYNDFEGLNDKANQLKPLLKQGLESLDYHLSNVQVKTLKQGKRPMLEIPGQNNTISLQGVDYRI